MLEILNSILEVTSKVDIVIDIKGKYVSMIMEYNAREAEETNVKGTKNILKASIKNKVSKFLHISTDKVVYPKSVMGKTKLMAEKSIHKIIKKLKKIKIKISIISLEML